MIIKIIFALLALLTTIIGFLEIQNLKNYVQENKIDPAINTMILYSDEVQKNPNRILHFRLIGKDAKILHAAEVPRNNLGYFSNFNYFLKKEKNEFRIVVLGGEQTASSLSNTSWPDYLKAELEEKINSKVSIINIAWPDAGPEHYIQQWKEVGQNFSPDLVIINYVETDFYRGIKGGPASYKGKPIEYKKMEFTILNPPNNIAKIGVPIVSGTDPLSIADSYAIPSRPYGFLVSPEFINSIDKIESLQKQVVNDMIAGGTPCFLCLTWYKLKGVRYPTVAQNRDLDSPQNQPQILINDVVAYGSNQFSWLISNIPNLLIIHNFHYGELKQDFSLTDKMKELNPIIDTIDMRKKIPKETSDETLRSWYLIPFMGEKWSDLGHKAYSKLVSEVVLEWRKNNNYQSN